MKTVTEVFEDHLAKRMAGQVEEDIKTNYSPGIILLTGTGILKGHQGVRESSKQLAEYVHDAQFNYRLRLVDGKYAFLEWTAESDDVHVPDGADSFVIEDGKIVFQSIHYSVQAK